MNVAKNMNAPILDNKMPINIWLQIIYLNRGSRTAQKSKTNIKKFRIRFHRIQTKLMQYMIIDNLRLNKTCNKSHFGASWTCKIRIYERT